MDTPPIRKACHRRNTPGHAHYLTFSCFQRHPFLARPRTCQWLIDALSRALPLHDLRLWAWVIMPEHVHLLIQPQPINYSIAAILQSIKQPVSQRAVTYVRQSAPEFLTHMHDPLSNGKSVYRFWQRGGGYDRNLYTPHEIHEKIQYIHRNPVRRGLTLNPTDYPWSRPPTSPEPEKVHYP